jgi:hypothetical protein
MKVGAQRIYVCQEAAWPDRHPFPTHLQNVVGAGVQRRPKFEQALAQTRARLIFRPVSPKDAADAIAKKAASTFKAEHRHKTPSSSAGDADGRIIKVEDLKSSEKPHAR